MLYLVSTPIGNLQDMTLRAIEVLKQVDFIAAEDTRHSAHLLSHYHINTPCFSLHDHNEAARIEKIITLLREKKSVALISDAGTPLISDPGYKVVTAVRAVGFKVIPIPGACAVIAAIAASGLPTDVFSFYGFLPAKKNALEKYLENLKTEDCTMIFYESPHRIKNTIHQIKKTFGEARLVSIARELTKTFETIYTDTAEACAEWIEDPNHQKGEFVVMVARAQAVAPSCAADEHLIALLKVLLSEITLKQAVKIACQLTKQPKNYVYELAIQLQHADLT